MSTSWLDAQTNLEPNARIVVRLRTEYWSTDRGVFKKTCVLYLKSKSSGVNFIEEDASFGGPELVIPKIINLDECADGIYEVICVNEYRDWETGYVEDWDYKLVPYTE